jgi:hypothetical protein
MVGNGPGSAAFNRFNSRHHAISQAAKKGDFIVNLSEKWFRQDWESHVALEHWLSGRVYQLTVTQPEIAAILSWHCRFANPVKSPV